MFHSDAAARSAERAARRPAGPGVLGRVLTSPRRRRSVQYVSVSSPSPPPSLPCRDPHRRPSPRGGWPGSMQGAGSILFHFLDPSQTPPPAPFAGEADPLRDLQPGQCAAMCVGCACVRAACVCALTETKVIGLKTWVCRGRVLALSCFHVESAHPESSCLQPPRPLLDQSPGAQLIPWGLLPAVYTAP